MTTNQTQWWESPEGEEFHTPRVWGEIESAARAAGDNRRADEAREAGEAETRNCGA